MDRAKLKLVHEATLDSCDVDDGIRDGFISKFATLKDGVWRPACNHDAVALRCPDGKEGGSCLSDVQLEVVRVIRSHFHVPFAIPGSGEFLGFGAMGCEAHAGTWDTALIGTKAPPAVQPQGVASLGSGSAAMFGFANIRYFVAQNASFQTYDFDPMPFEQRIQYVSAMIDVSFNLSEFFESGGKLIMKDNSCDYHRNVLSSLNYYQVCST